MTTPSNSDRNAATRESNRIAQEQAAQKEAGLAEENATLKQANEALAKENADLKAAAAAAAEPEPTRNKK